MRSAVGFRNISVHSYDDIDWDIVWSIITLHIDDFRKYASEVSHYYELFKQHKPTMKQPHPYTSRD